MRAGTVHNNAWVTQREKITMFSEGYDAVQIELSLSDEWDGLSKIGVFRAGDVQIDVPVTTSSVTIPVNAILVPNVHLFFGLYGISTANGRVAIPTTWADLGIIQPAADPTAASNYGQPVPDLYDQLAALAASAAAAAQTAASGAHAGTASWSINEDGHMIMSVTEGGSTSTTDLGPVTAFGIVKDDTPPYPGTYEDFQDLLQANAIAAETLEEVQEGLQTVSATASTASTNAAAAVTTANAASATANAASAAVTTVQTAVAGKQSQHKKGTVTLVSGASEWSTTVVPEVTEQTVVTATNTVFYGPAPASVDAYAEAGVRMTAQTGNNTVTFAATNSTTEDIIINIVAFD